MDEALRHLFGLERKVALITGGNGGIGKGIARGLASAGADVVIAARNESKTARAVEEIASAFGVRCLGLQVDVCRETEVKSMVARTHEAFGGPDIFVSNAGMAIHRSPEEMSLEEWDRNIQTNLRSFFMGAQAVFPFMKEAGGGKIISIGSMYTLFGSEALPAYGASKGGIVQLTKSLAVAWAPYNIQVNSILPGASSTPTSRPTANATYPVLKRPSSDAPQPAGGAIPRTSRARPSSWPVVRRPSSQEPLCPSTAGMP